MKWLALVFIVIMVAYIVLYCTGHQAAAFALINGVEAIICIFLLAIVVVMML